MSKSLTGGLVPLGKRTGSTPTGSSTLSGGLIPLATGRGTKATATLGGIHDGSSYNDVGGGIGGTARDEEEEDPTAGKEGVGLGSGREKKRTLATSPHASVACMELQTYCSWRRFSLQHKRSSSSKADSSRSSRRGRAKAVDQTTSRGGSKEDLANTTDSSKKLATKPEEDDSYLFMGATAGTKGRNSGGGAAEAAALLLDSDDSFGLPKMGGGRKIKPTPRKSATETTGDNAGGGYSKDDGEQGRKQETDTSYFSSVTKHAQPTSRADETGDTYSSGTARAATAGGDGSPQDASPRLDLDVDFDSPDEADALLRLTDPTALAASAPAVPPLRAAHPRKDDKRRGRADTAPSAVSERRATGQERAPRQRSPSPPVSHRRDLPESPERSPRRLLPGRSFTHGKPAGDNTGRVLERTGGVGGLDLGRLERAESGAHPVTSVSTERAEKLVTIEPAIRSRSRVRGVGLSQTSSPEKVGVEGDETAESLRVHGPGVEMPAGNSGHNHDGSHKQGVGGGAGGSSIGTGAGVASGNVPRRSALAKVDKPRSLEPKTRGVTFDDDLGGLDALDILPSSDDDDDEAPGGKPADEQPKPLLNSSTATDRGAPRTVKPIIHSAVEESDRYRPSESHATTSSLGMTKRGPTSITKGLSPAAARLMAEDSSSEESIAGASVAGASLGLEAGPKSRTAVDVGIAASLGLGSKATDGGDGDITDDAKLDLALGFTPSAMDGGRRPRRTLPAGRRARSSTGVSPTTDRGGADNSATVDSALTASVIPLAVPTSITPPLRGTPRRFSQAETGAVMGRGKDAGDGEASHPNLTPPPAFPRVVGKPVSDLTGTPEGGLGVNAVIGAPLIPAANVEPLAAASRTVKGPAIDTAPIAGASEYTGGEGRQRGSAPSPKQVAAAGKGNMDASVLVSLERQLALLAGDRESAATRLARDEQRLQRESDSIRDALSAAEARAFEAEAALAAARARIQQLEVEAAENASRLAASESRAALGRRAEQETCLTKISDGERRHQQSDLHKAETRHEETVSELKRLHHEEVEDIRRRNADSKTLETLAGQVHESAGAVKLLQAEMVQRKGISEVSREGQMEARERLVKELEQSARRAQQTAEDEVQRLQGTLMAMDQVMRALRGQNAGERERLRQEHLRMETLQVGFSPVQ
ncbi:unnamed protein product [Laminaria digitata]